MDKIKFLMTDTGAQTTQLCRQALEAKGIDVTVCEKNGSQALKCCPAGTQDLWPLLPYRDR